MLEEKEKTFTAEVENAKQDIDKQNTPTAFNPLKMLG